jgi:hypothetical protein
VKESIILRIFVGTIFAIGIIVGHWLTKPTIVTATRTLHDGKLQLLLIASDKAEAELIGNGMRSVVTVDGGKPVICTVWHSEITGCETVH